MSDRDEPAWGSVSAMVPKKRPSIIGCRKRCFCSSLPKLSIRLAAPMVRKG
ncbi:hypothetical protein D3C84_1245840 [compost metagenome]